MHHTQTIGDRPNDEILLTFMAPMGWDLIRWYLSVSDVVRIAGPAEFKRQVKQQCAEVAAGL